ncbi:hypothetical protein B296_00048405 [Ensete ventricosum]|uniref:Uncharacterized protein n=1 Tax=Ensete ventricosum TaxID=4639 RepID=A0A426YNM5_ENSVE|nr:hypothetical protein B296_00048405 [Ensete ventricosum]
MPSRDHPSMLRVEEELQKVKSSVIESSSTADVIFEGLRGIQGLYGCIEELLCLPSSNQIFSNPQQRKWVEVELDLSVRLLDLLGTLRDSTNSIKEKIRDLEMTLRRQGETVVQSKMQAYIRPDKKAEKDVKNCFRFLKQMDDKYALCFTDDKESDSRMLVRTLKEAREITISLLQSIFNFLSMTRPKTKTSRLSLISKALHKRKMACKGEHEDIEANDRRVQKARDQLQTVQNSFDGIEAGLECLFRSLDEVLPHFYAGRRGVASYFCVVTRRRLVHLLEGEVLPRLPSLGQGAASFFCWKARRGQGGASSSYAMTRRHLVLPLEEEASPRLPSLGRSTASFFYWKARRRLVFLC